MSQIPQYDRLTGAETLMLSVSLGALLLTILIAIV